MTARPPAPGRWRRQGRLFLGLAAAGFVALALALVVLRPVPEPYTPGASAADKGEITRRLDRDLPEDLPDVRFTEAAEVAGLRFQHFHGQRSTQLPEDMGSGLAWGDYDGDGDPDLFLTNMAGPLTLSEAEAEASPAHSALYRNNGDGTFTDVTEAAGAGVGGWGMGAAWGDADGDGDLDLVVSRYGTNVLLRNDGDGSFSDISAASGVGDATGFWAGVSWSDFDRDGDLDLYVCGYVRYRYEAADAARTSLQYRAVVPYTLNPSTYAPARNLLLRNDRGRFQDVAAQAGVANEAGRSLSASWADLDGDGWPDLYVANDISDNVLYHNRGDGTFLDVSHSAWVADYRGAMGLGVGDWENDGDLDLFVTHWIAQENALYENQHGIIAASPGEPLHFVDQADMHGLGQIAIDYIGWGAEFLDYDNDGRLDLLAVNGSTFQRDDDPALLVPMPNLLFWNAGRDRGFFSVGEVSGEPFTRDNVGRGAAAADYDGDGDLDIAILVNGNLARLLRNDGGDAGGSVRVVLRGAGPGRTGGAAATTTFAVGARVRVRATGVDQIREVGAGSSYLSQGPPGEVHFGLGTMARLEEIEVSWPSGARQRLPDVPARATVFFTEGEEPRVEPQMERPR